MPKMLCYGWRPLGDYEGDLASLKAILPRLPQDLRLITARPSDPFDEAWATAG